MNDDKIFADLKGILSWIEFNKTSKNRGSKSKFTVQEGIEEIIDF